MAIAFPVTLANFFNALEIVECSFGLVDNVTLMNTGGGEVISSAYGVRLWRGRVRTRVLPHASAEAILARIRMIANARASFFVNPLQQRISGVGAPTVLNVQNGYEIRFAGMTAGKVIPQGTFFSFAYDGGRLAFHQTVENVTVGSTGETPFVQVEPEVRPGWTVGLAVSFTAPQAKAVYIPNTLTDPAIRAVLTDGPSFDWQQTLRK